MGTIRKIQKKEKEKVLPFFTRDEWGAQEPAGKLIPLKLPVTHVRFGYTASEPCRNREVCEDVLQDYQTETIDEGFNDLPYNFLVGGDGAIYEGRGWEVEAQRPSRLKNLDGKCIDIAYIGDFESNPPPAKMTEAAEWFINESIEQKKIRYMPTTMGLHDFKPEDNDFEE